MAHQGAGLIEREAEGELVEALARGELCAVRGPRQAGKSSLRRRVEQRLEARGVRCVALDLGLIGSVGLTEERWFYAVAFHLAKGWPALDLLGFWRASGDLSPAERWSRFLREELLAQTPEPVAVLLDEIDVALGLPFSERFFAEIRAAHGARLTFCSFGVAAPFGAGRVIALEHPHTTQRLCAALSEGGVENGVSPEDRVARPVHEVFEAEEILVRHPGSFAAIIKPMDGTLRARVEHGRLVLDEPISLPEGTEIDLIPADLGDELDEADRARLDAAIDRGLAAAGAGKTTPADEVIAALRSIHRP